MTNTTGTIGHHCALHPATAIFVWRCTCSPSVNYGVLTATDANSPSKRVGESCISTASLANGLKFDCVIYVLRFSINRINGERNIVCIVVDHNVVNYYAATGTAVRESIACSIVSDLGFRG